MRISDRDRALRQFEWDAAVACGAMAAIALAIGRGRPDGAASVLAGGALMALSYWAIKGGVDVLVGASSRAGLAALPGERGGARQAALSGEGGGAEQAAPPAECGGAGLQPSPVLPPARRVWLAVKFFTRYALLAVGAYVMLTCFRLHPVGLLAGAMTPFVAAIVLAVRSSRASSLREHP